MFLRKAIDFFVLFFQTLFEPFLEFANKNSGGSDKKKSAWKGSGSSTGGGDDGRGGGGKPNIHGLKHSKLTYVYVINLLMCSCVCLLNVFM